MSNERPSPPFPELTPVETEAVAGGLSGVWLPAEFEVRWQTLTGSISLQEAVDRGYLPG
jgi:hypothetical protein